MDDSKWSWVNAFMECSIVAVFDRLKLDIERDVKERIALRPPEAPYSFNTVPSGTQLVVSIVANNMRQSVTFSQTQKGLVVRDEDGKLILEASLTLNDQGESRFKINGQEYESWQLRKRALEKLFFEVV